jgi:hypothetical protein
MKGSRGGHAVTAAALLMMSYVIVRFTVRLARLCDLRRTVDGFVQKIERESRQPAHH